MARRVLLAAFVVAAATSVAGDVYMHNPRGSNNRLNEQSAARTNGNRLFNSQNNNRGGYNVGDRGRNAYNANDGAAGSYSDPATTFDRTKNVQDTAIQYQMQYFEGSELTFEWTNQHGCGGSEADDPSKLNCDLLIQYMCQTTDGLQDPQTGMLKTPPKTKAGRDQIMGAESLRDGTNTNTPNTLTALTDGATITTNLDKGHHESEAYYFECQSRSRNRGLFLADQNMGGNSARFTRQNNNGNRNGLECPEERDYYPYWSPSPWKDVVLMTDRPQERCDAGGFYNGASQNNHDVYKCVIAPTATTLSAAMAAITQAACEQAQGTWTAFQHGIAPPRCEKAQWSRVNHLGNGRDGNPLRWTWHLPLVQDLIDQGAYQYTGPAPDNAPMVKCVARLRYNISTDDFDPDKTDYQYNQNNAYKKTNPITGNPVVDIGAGPMPWQGLQLNVNTAQFARTFQDRSHIFYIRKRPASIPSDAKIYNLNVRGKRGNIVQTFPAVEYDFIPNQLTVTPNDYVHVQWTGSNTHNNGNPGGDGQTGDAGEGRTGTDRHNMAQMLDRTRNYPLPLDKFPDNMWSRSTCYNPDGTPFSSGSSTPGDISQNRAALDCAIYMTTSGQFVSYDDVNTAAQGNGKQTFDPLLDDAPASLIGGILMKFQPDFTANGGQDKVDYHYMNTRNNNFSNRGQRGTITVVPT